MSAALFVGSILLACGGSATPQSVTPDSQPAPTPLCASPMPGMFGVTTLHNKTSKKVELDATDDLMMTAMTGSNCFTVVERDKVQLLIEEMRLCDPTANKDVSYFDCPSFAQKGHLLGVTQLVTGDLLMLEPNVTGAELHLKLPWIGGLSGGTSYAAVAISMRVLDVATGKVVASTNVSAQVPSSEGGADLSVQGLDLGAAAHSNTPMGKALDAMIRQAVVQLQQAMANAPTVTPAPATTPAPT